MAKKLNQWERAAATRKARAAMREAEEAAAIANRAKQDNAGESPRAQSPSPSERLVAVHYLNREELGKHVARLISHDRNATHGDPNRQFACAQDIKELLRVHQEVARARNGDRPLPITNIEALEMIATKISRIIHGSNAQDAWLDIAGYALIAAEHSTARLTAQEPS